jgi:hypothetical protein
MPGRHPLDGAFERINRAHEHLVELERVVHGFTQDHHDAVVVQFNANPPYDLVFHTPQLFPYPRIGILTGEICYNLRSALDYLIYELARLDSGAIKNGTQFPIEETREGFQGRRRVYLSGINPDHVLLIEGLQPYNGCRWTRALKDISNPDKHRHLTAANYGGWIAADRPGITFPPTGFPETQISSTRRVAHPFGIEMDIHLITSFTVQIPMEEPVNFPATVSVQGLLQYLKAEVARLLETFKPEFSDHVRAP